MVLSPPNVLPAHLTVTPTGGDGRPSRRRPATGANASATLQAGVERGPVEHGTRRSARACALLTPAPNASGTGQPYVTGVELTPPPRYFTTSISSDHNTAETVVASHRAKVRDAPVLPPRAR